MRHPYGSHSGIVVTLITALLVTPLAPSTTYAQESNPLDWSNVMRLRAGESILVQLDEGKFTGTVDEVGPDSLAVTTKARGPMVFPRPTIKAVRNSGRLSKPGIALVSGGMLLATVGGLIGSAQDLNTLADGRFPENRNVSWAHLGFGVMGVGAWMLVAGGGKTIYRRLTD